VFEDLHWADDGLIDFITELVERSARSPILVITLARPDLLARYPGWGSGRRNSMSMQLAPLSEESMRALVEGTVPGLPGDAIETVIARAGGVPLYAVEFIRMLISTGDVVRSAEGQFELVGDLADLSIPETVQAVIGSRLDRLSVDDRTLLQDASVLGLSFTPVALAGIRGERVEAIRERLLSLVRDELLELEEDPRSPERGQYRFVQGLIREVAYGRLGREDRAERHVRAARYYEELGDIELAAALATHYMAAFEASRGATDLVVKARNALVGAAKRAAELHAHRQVISLLTKALEISPDAVDAAAILERLSEASIIAGDNEAAIRFALDAEGRSRVAGDDSGRKRAATLAARAYTSSYHTSDAQALLEPLYDPECADADAVTLDMELELARSYMFGDPPRSLQIAERALSRDRGALSPATLINGIINRGNALGGVGRALEARALMRGVVEVADELGLQRQAIRALWNLGVQYQFDDLQRSNTNLREVLERSRRIGDQQWAQISTDASALADIYEGRFADAAATLTEFDDPDLPEAIRLQAEYSKSLLKLYQRPTPEDFVHTRRVLDTLITDADLLTQREIAHSEIDLLEGNFSAAANRRIIYTEAPLVPTHAFLAAIWAGDEAVMSRGVSDMSTGNPGRYADAVATLLRAALLAIGGDRETAATGFRTAIETLSRVGLAMETAIARAVFAKRIGLDHPEAAAAASMARALFEQVGADQVLKVFAAALPGEVMVAATGS
jgi:tetratricopeptide (TPR) repeat protein